MVHFSLPPSVLLVNLGDCLFLVRIVPYPRNSTDVHLEVHARWATALPHHRLCVELDYDRAQPVADSPACRPLLYALPNHLHKGLRLDLFDIQA